MLDTTLDSLFGVCHRHDSEMYGHVVAEINYAV